MSNLKQSKRFHEFFLKFKKMNKEEVGFKDWSTNQQAVSLLMTMYFCWAVVGLMTSQWIVFIAIHLMSFIPKKYIIVIKIDAFITLCLLIFAILNEYHLHINLIDIIKQ
jgi:hypothetical protein